MAGRGVPIIISAITGIALGSIATMLLTAPPDHRGEMPPGALPSTATVPASTPGALPADGVEIQAARHALSARLRSPDALQLSDVRVHDYGTADERAVCGTMRSPEISGGTARFVVRVLQPRNAGTRPPQTVVEDAPWLVRPGPEAARRFCRDPEPVPTVQPGVPETSPAATAAVPPLPPPAASVAAGGRVTTQSPANLRAAPSGEVLASIPRGRTLIVFDRAPGGWLQVGETAPQGWVHSSLLSDVGQQ